MELSDQQLNETSRRNMIYRVLAISWYYPGLELAQSLVEQEFAAVLNLCFDVSGNGVVDDTFIREYTRKLTGGNLHVENLKCTLAQEYTRLFLAPVPEHPVIPLYESVYTSTERLLMQEAAVAVRKCYRKAGLDLRGDFKDLPDHIATELEFMHWLTGMEYQAREQGKTEQAKDYLTWQGDFFRKHLSRWVPNFVHRLKNMHKYLFIR